MPEYIEREALIEAYDTAHKGPPGCARKLMVDAPPAADVAPVVRGRWEHIDTYLIDVWRCTVCGEEWTFSYDPTDADTKVNYCPDCGARMDGE